MESNENKKPENEPVNGDVIKINNADTDKNDVDSERNVFDAIADFFQIMSLGILKFAFIKLPKFLWDLLKKLDIKVIFRYLYSISRIIFWLTFLIFLFCLFQIVFFFEKFKAFWIWVGNSIIHFGEWICRFIMNYGQPIWFIIALIGSIYGILYMKRRGILSSIVAYFKNCRRKPRSDNQTDGNDNNQTDGNDNNQK